MGHTETQVVNNTVCNNHGKRCNVKKENRNRFSRYKKAMWKFETANNEARTSQINKRKTDVILLTEFFSGD